MSGTDVLAPDRPGDPYHSEILRQTLALAESVARLQTLVDQTSRSQAEFVLDQERHAATLYSPEDGLVVQVREIKTVGRFAARIGWAVVTSSGGSFLVMLAVAYKALEALEQFRGMVEAGGITGG